MDSSVSNKCIGYFGFLLMYTDKKQLIYLKLKVSYGW